jgi:hypothetical protein
MICLTLSQDDEGEHELSKEEEQYQAAQRALIDSEAEVAEAAQELDAARLTMQQKYVQYQVRALDAWAYGWMTHAGICSMC